MSSGRICLVPAVFGSSAGMEFPVDADAYAECPRTLIQASQAQVPLLTTPNEFDLVWHGTHKLAVLINKDGNFCEQCGKMWWWREGEWDQDKLHVNARLLDNPDITATSWWTSSGTFDDGSRAMLNPIDFPSAGCWEVTASYHDDTSLTFVTYVSEPTESTYGMSGVNVNAENLQQLFKQLAGGLRMRDYFGYTWNTPKDWQSFEIELAKTPFPEMLEVYGFSLLKIRMPLDAEKLATLLQQAAASAGITTIEFK